MSVLKPLSSKGILANRPFATFDVETKDGLKGKELYCWSLCYYDRNKKCILTSTEKDFSEMFAILNRTKSNSYGRKQTVFIHNIDFDIRFIIEYLFKRDIEFSVIKSNRLIAIVCNDIVFIDSLQFLLCSQDIAEQVYGVPSDLRKIDCTAIFNKKYPEWTETDKITVLEHNRNDVSALHYIMKRFRKTVFEQTNCDVLSHFTLPSLALSTFRKMMRYDIPNPFVVYNAEREFQANKPLDSYVRQSYKGGRTEVFRLGPVGDCSVYDVVSLYPSVMASNSFPYGEGTFVSDPSVILTRMFDGGEGFARVVYEPPRDLFVPVLAATRNDKLCFTAEKNTGIYAFPELRLAIEKGYGIEILDGIVFDSFSPFKKFVDYFFGIKTAKEGSERAIAKLFLNSLYGKFGQKFERTCYEYIKNEDRDTVMELCQHARQYGSVWIGSSSRVEEKVKPFQNVAIASYVTSHARCLLYEALVNCGDKLLYCDTDSVFVEKGYVPNLKFGKNLGNWDKEHDYGDLHILAPKAYVAVENGNVIVKLKGLDRITVNRILAENKTVIDVVESLKEPIQMVERYCTLHSGIRKGDPVSSFEMEKHFEFGTTKREFNDSGFSRPWGSSAKFK